MSTMASSSEAPVDHMLLSFEEACLEDSLKTLNLMGLKGTVPIHRDVMLRLLQVCIKRKSLLLARQVHCLIISSGLSLFSIFQDHLIRLFASCGSLSEANQVFCSVCEPTSQTWSFIISAHTELGESELALRFFEKAQLLGAKPEKFLFVSTLTACGSVGFVFDGALIHHQIVESGMDSNLVVGNSLIDMYAKCTSLKEAQRVFDVMVDRDVVTWNALISGYAQQECDQNALELFAKMQNQGVKPCKVTYLTMLKACGSLGRVDQGAVIHRQTLRCGFASDITLANALIDMYVKCGSLEEAQQLFRGMQNKTSVTWGTIIAGYAGQGYGLLAFQYFKQMLQDGVKPNKIILSCLLKACSGLLALDEGMLIHVHVIIDVNKFDLIIGNALVDMYAKCGSLDDAKKVFDSLAYRDDVSWNSIISGYAQQGCLHCALELFERMQQAKFQPSAALILCILKACTSRRATEEAMMVHGHIIEKAIEVDVVIGNTLVDMYAKCGSLLEAHKVFNKLQDRTVVSWGAILMGYAAQGRGILVWNLFVKMQEEGKEPNEVIYLTVLKACLTMGNLVHGRILHDHMIRHGLESNLAIVNTLIDMYVKCGGQQEGRKLFDNLSAKDEVSWGVIIDGYVQNGDGCTALELLAEMQGAGFEPNTVVFLLVLKACGNTGASEQGRLIHDHIIECGLELEGGIATTLIDMYVNCGNLMEAHRVLQVLQIQEAEPWNALITGYSQYGDWDLVEQCIDEMQREGFKPDGCTFTSILAAFSHAGEVEKGYQYFKRMGSTYGLTPTVEHLNCMVDLLARVGRLMEAARLLETMPVTSNITGWLSLLTACRTFGNIELGAKCYYEAIQLDPEGASGYMLMSNIYADTHMQDDVLNVQERRKLVGAWKKPGKVCIQVNNRLQQFVVGDHKRMQIDTIFMHTNVLNRRVKEVGYMPCLDLITEPGFCEDL